MYKQDQWKIQDTCYPNQSRLLWKRPGIAEYQGASSPQVPFRLTLNLMPGFFFFFCEFFLVCLLVCLETGFHCVSPVDLELTMYTRLALNTCRSACLCLSSIGTNAVYHCGRLLSWILSFHSWK